MYHVCKTAETATAMTTLVSFETRSAQKGPMAFHKQPRSPEKIFLPMLENEEPKLDNTYKSQLSLFLFINGGLPFHIEAELTLW